MFHQRMFGRNGTFSLGSRSHGPEPIRFDFWTGRDLTEAGRDLARMSHPDLRATPDDPLRRLDENRLALQSLYLHAVEAAESGELITPAAEWLIDNHHMVEENLRQLREGFDRNFLRNLPRQPLADGREMPRALIIAWYFVALTNSEIEDGQLTAFLEGYQSESVLEIAELWAIPTFLRFILIENLRRLAERVAIARLRRFEGNRIADSLADATGRADIEARVAREAAMIRHDTVAVQLLYRLRDGGDSAQMALAAVERQLGRADAIDRAVQAEYTRQSSGNVTTGNIIRSLRKLGDIDWLRWFEGVSRIDRLLSDGTEFGRLDKPTRSDYRTVIERIARRSTLSEMQVAQLVLELAEDAHPHKVIGHLLVGAEQHRFEEACGYRPTISERFDDGFRRLGWLGIAVPMAVITALLVLGLHLLLPASLPGWSVVLLLVLAVIPASETALRLISFIAARTVRPQRLPAMDFHADGPPPEARTLVVIPGMISSLDAVDELAEMIESHYLANPRGEVIFALLTDWRDAPREHEPDDDRLLSAARERIDALADRYDHNGTRRFFLLHRRRVWNEAEGVWMGWERKRGKLAELNEMLRGHADTSFIDTGPTPPEGVRYVITLDSDTRLPRETVTALVGKMAHPVNTPVAREDGVVIRGHAIMQPRVTPSLTTGPEASIFQRIFSTNRGLDPYVFTVSDLYQDLFAEGSFTGKGIYDVDAFEAAMAGRIPENTVLSHDLLEGSLARAALVTDVEVVEDFPLRAATEASRQHRWTRGDWQLLPFIVNPLNGLNALARFKMFDNLRRSLMPILWVAASIAGWLTLPGWHAALWQIALIGLLALVAILQVDLALLRRRRGLAVGYHLRGMVRDAANYMLELGLRITGVAERAANMADAIALALWRRFVSHKHLLEWTTAREAARKAAASPWQIYSKGWASPAIGLLALAATAWLNPSALPVASVMSILWIASPWIGERISRPLVTEDRLSLSPAEDAALRQIGRQTWRFFEEFVGPDTNHLPPDNFQDHPAPKLAERTSPTNIGLYLMSVMSARDLGWIGFDTALRRISATLETMERMPRHRGHFFNWYDTRTLAVLPTPYVSSVDSGNLAGLLIALASGLRRWGDATASAVQVKITGLADTLALLERAYADLPAGRRGSNDVRKVLEERLAGFAGRYRSVESDPQTAPVGIADLGVLARDIERLAGDLDATENDRASADLLWWARALRVNCDEVLRPAAEGRDALASVTLRLHTLSERARALAFRMDFSLFVRPDKQLLSIGYRPGEDELDESCYDLLASEARLTSFLAIAKGDLPKDHWSQLGRPFATFGNRGALLSWSGCMFEYLMPPLLMRERQGGILHHSNAMAIEVQIEHGRARAIPWGISESAFNARDRQLNYQYYAFGVPALALKRGGGDPVVAPYASILAAQMRPKAAVSNLAWLADIGALGPWGYYDAVDFTPSRQSGEHRHEVVRNVMAHHHGMSILAIANTVLDGIHRDRFHDDPVVRAAELLLQEKSPRDIVPITRAPSRTEAATISHASASESISVVDEPGRARTEVALLSNGHFATTISATGSGRSVLNGVAVNRWHPDPTCDRGGIYLLMRDVQSGEWWSATTSPCAGENEKARTIISDHKAEFFKTANAIESRVEVIAATEANADGRRLTLRNRSGSDRTIEVTSYGEIVLDEPASDNAHPAFSKMFVKTEIRGGGSLIVAERRPRDPKGQSRYLAHLVAGADSAMPAATEAETDRYAFIGRGRTLADPAAFDPGATLGGGQGHTLDPIFAIRRRVRLPAGKSVSLVFWTIMTDTEQARDDAAAHYARPTVFDHELRLAWTWSQVQLRHVGVTLEEARLFRRFAALLVYPRLNLSLMDPDRRGALGSQSSLWPMGISGDQPIILIRIDDETDLPIVASALKMHEFLRVRSVPCDIVILNERAASYIQDLQHAIRNLCDLRIAQAGGPMPQWGVHAVRRDQISPESYDTLLAAARIVLHTRNGTLAEQIDRLPDITPPRAADTPPRLPARRQAQPPAPTPLQFWNGYGGFTDNGREYVMRLRADRPTPHPWINVIAREDFGFHVSAEGASYTWAENSRDYQITPWSNDPVGNRPGEAILIHDPATGRVATPFPALCDDPSQVFEIAHGMGYSRFTADFGWVEVEAVMMLAENQPARLTRLRVTNHTRERLSLQGIAYAEMVKGIDPARTSTMLRARYDADAGAVILKNPYSTDFADRTTALSCDQPIDGACASRAQFLGRNGSLSRPRALTHWPESDAGDELQTDADPCAAIRWQLPLAAGDTIESVLTLADAPADAIDGVLSELDQRGVTDLALTAAGATWDDFLGTLQVDTPDPKLNLLVNTWLPYQALGCRMRARTAFYQASGAFGFRDQLQDSAALILQDPDLCRRQILNAASRQFPEGDVQHWWLPRTGAGVRTMITDDVVWLGHITAHYVEATGDTSILDETLPFINGPRLDEGEHDRFFQPEKSEESAPLYDHCARALDLALARTGPNGLPLILGGDWNDGMNRVGEGGRGESVWLGWFLCATIDRFAPIAEARGDGTRAEAWRAHRQSVSRALDKSGWDGAWYRRGYFDDGTPLGSVDSTECRIDSIAQSWALISGAGREDRAHRAVDAAVDWLFDEKAGILRLFTPPFSATEAEPGYIKSYPPGVRENGGQYTHAAAWMVYALAQSGDGTRAHRIFDAINPISHAADRASAEQYRVEPYVVAADIYGAPDKLGRGGWTWYTGSAGWMFRAAVEGILGIERRPGGFVVAPNLPDDWPGFSATITIDGHARRVEVTRGDRGLALSVDGVAAQPGAVIEV
ncbi:protein ndvB [Paracoccus sp. TK19116]|uniref:Protein ndvB n=1 Tax=Paracoccus albicereus TaxID=2922394 RepID=A0ABT1MPL2_9RHOB|nr:glucoamylase family protein [Paracoccus albicereus]MCQ0970237.1 protein ndvB [Paracoccus albicereus]